MKVQWEKNLPRLRSQGMSRLHAYAKKPGLNCGSLAFQTLGLDFVGTTLTYVDLGAGESADCLLAADLGYRAFALDLFPPRTAPPKYSDKVWPSDKVI